MYLARKRSQPESSDLMKLRVSVGRILQYASSSVLFLSNFITV